MAVTSLRACAGCGFRPQHAQRLRQVHDRDRPVLDHVASPVASAGHGTLDIDGVLAELSASAEALREAVHEGTHHVRGPSAALGAVRGRRGDEEEPR